MKMERPKRTRPADSEPSPVGGADGEGRAAESRPQIRRRVHPSLPSVVGLVLAVAAVVVLRESGSLRSTEDALQIMGFDLDRSILIAGLIAGAVAAAIVSLVAGHPVVAVLASLGAGGAVFGATFARETRHATASTGFAGNFDPGGWVLTVVTLAVTAAVVGWASATLVAAVRRSAVLAADDVRAVLPVSRRAVGRLGRPVVLVITVALIAGTLPVFADMVNYSPDTRMLAGAPAQIGLANAVPADSPPIELTPSTVPIASVPVSSPSDLILGPQPSSLITANAVSTDRPWASSPHSGSSRFVTIQMPGPWTHGLSPVISAEIYLPPGYDTTSGRYPVLYEFPYGLESWAKGVNIQSMLDDLIRAGSIPPLLMVFATTFGSPFRDSECADSYDGREKLDTYAATELVPAIDAQFRTIPRSAARALIGASQGGYCSAALWSHHPDVFGSAISFSGYFVAGVISTQTLNAGRPFAANAAYEASQSPINVVARMAASLRATSFVILSADPSHPFFGTQLRAFAAVLDQAAVPLAILPAPFGHSWQTEREELPIALELLAGRMVKLGVFGGA